MILPGTVVVRFGLPAGVKVEPAAAMTKALTRHEKVLKTRIPSIRFHPVRKTSHQSGIVVTPAGQTAIGSCDRICRIARMTANFAGVKVEPAGGMPRSRTLHANKSAVSSKQNVAPPPRRRREQKKERKQGSTGMAGPIVTWGFP